MAKLDITDVPTVRCPLHPMERSMVNQRCTREEYTCPYYNGMADGCVDCLRKEMPSIRGIHVTEFAWKGDTYRSRRVTQEEAELADDYNVCPFCCWHKELDNDRCVCMLRSGVDDEMIDGFICYEDEIWEKLPDGDDA